MFESGKILYARMMTPLALAKPFRLGDAPSPIRSWIMFIL